MSALDVGQALPRRRIDILPALTPFIAALAAAPFIGSFSTFVTLTAAGLAMGMMIFTMASGLTLVFGVMDVLNFGHGAFIALGAYAASLVLLALASWSSADSLSMNLAVFILAALAAALMCGAFGWVFERVLVKPAYGQHLKQILATIGGAIIAEQLLYAVFGPAQIPLNVPKTFEGSFVFGEAAIEKYRVLATLVGLAVFLGEMLILNRTKIGLLIRAGVENREMVEALGYRVDQLFVAVFMAGSALAGLGGAVMALYRGQVHATIGSEFLVLCFIVIIIGGLGSVGGSFVASILVALIANYAGFLAPKLALVSNILAMVAVLLWRPRGLYPVSGR
jgi:branched-chain amino acid transport system permease protein